MTRQRIDEEQALERPYRKIEGGGSQHAWDYGDTSSIQQHWCSSGEADNAGGPILTFSNNERHVLLKFQNRLTQQPSSHHYRSCPLAVVWTEPAPRE